MIFWITIMFILSSFFALTIGQHLPIEFKNTKISSDYYFIVFTYLPFAILLSLIGTIKKKNKIEKNWIIGIMTVIGAVACFFYLTSIMFSVGFGAWTTETILYENTDNKNITIKKQIYDAGALGYGGDRIVKLTPFLYYFRIVEETDTTKIDKSKWIFVNKEGDIKVP